MTEKRIFTDQELEEMGARTLDLLLTAIDAGDKEGAQARAWRMQKEFQYLHDGQRLHEAAPYHLGHGGLPHLLCALSRDGGSRCLQRFQRYPRGVLHAAGQEEALGCLSGRFVTASKVRDDILGRGDERDGRQHPLKDCLVQPAVCVGAGIERHDQAVEPVG